MFSSLVGIIVVDNDQICHYCSTNAIPFQGNDEWLNDAENGLKKQILSGLVATGKAAKLHSFEQVKDIYLTFRQFTPENGLLTPSFKSKRPEIRKFYSTQIDQMYKNLD
jgi:long-chain acyl-CoA synthetase